jgi:hypothetical protein
MFFSRFSGGYNDDEVYLDEESRKMANTYYPLFLQLGLAELQNGDAEGFERVKSAVYHHLPPERIEPPENLEKNMRMLFKTGTSRMRPKSAGEAETDTLNQVAPDSL